MKVVFILVLPDQIFCQNTVVLNWYKKPLYQSGRHITLLSIAMAALLGDFLYSYLCRYQYIHSRNNVKSFYVLLTHIV